jgi:hypothetical protein
MTTRGTPVSGVGRFSARTDGAPGGGSGTAKLAAPGGAYGERKAIEGQAAAQPVPTPGGSGGGGGGGGGPVPQDPGGGAGVSGIFGPTERPNEPITAGLPPQAGGPAQDYAGKHTDMVIEQAYKKWPSPYLLGLMAPR